MRNEKEKEKEKETRDDTLMRALLLLAFSELTQTSYARECC